MKPRIEAVTTIDKRGLFIHVPKSAGMSILHTMKPFFWNKHDHIIMSHLWISEIPEDFWNETFSFAIVRHPLQRFVSMYLYLLKKNYLKKELSFKDFILNYDELLAPKEYWLVTQKEYLFEKNPYKKEIDFIGKFEEINEAWKFISTKLGLPGRLPFKNTASTGRSYRDFYVDRVVREQAIERAYPDLSCFHYQA